MGDKIFHPYSKVQLVNIIRQRSKLFRPSGYLPKFESFQRKIPSLCVLVKCFLAQGRILPGSHMYKPGSLTRQGGQLLEGAGPPKATDSPQIDSFF